MLRPIRRKQHTHCLLTPSAAWRPAGAGDHSAKSFIFPLVLDRRNASSLRRYERAD
jgi:hypothetical protein